eukprot:4679360-Amphidinium_carterae.5
MVRRQLSDLRAGKRSGGLECVLAAVAQPRLQCAATRSCRASRADVWHRLGEEGCISSTALVPDRTTSSSPPQAGDGQQDTVPPCQTIPARPPPRCPVPVRPRSQTRAQHTGGAAL